LSIKDSVGEEVRRSFLGKGEGHRKVEEAVDGDEKEMFFVKSSLCIYRTPPVAMK